MRVQNPALSRMLVLEIVENTGSHGKREPVGGVRFANIGAEP